MPLDPVVNFGKAVTSGGYSASALTVVLANGEGASLPSTFSYNLTWWNSTDYNDPSDDPDVEIVRISNRVGDTLTLSARAQEGTSVFGYFYIKPDISDLGSYSVIGHSHTEPDTTGICSFLTDISGSPLSELSNIAITPIATNKKR